jgi:hypothetical protein
MNIDGFANESSREMAGGARYADPSKTLRSTTNFFAAEWVMTLYKT